jgi:hypothetical protein
MMKGEHFPCRLAAQNALIWNFGGGSLNSKSLSSDKVGHVEYAAIRYESSARTVLKKWRGSFPARYSFLTNNM